MGNDILEILGYNLNAALPNFSGLSSKGHWVKKPSKEVISELQKLTREKGSKKYSPTESNANEVEPEISPIKISKEEPKVYLEEKENLKEDDVQLCIRAFQEACIIEHNRYRSMHHSPALKVSVKLNIRSQSYAQHLARTKDFKHSPGNGFGENLAASSTLDNLANCAGIMRFNLIYI